MANEVCCETGCPNPATYAWKVAHTSLVLYLCDEHVAPEDRNRPNLIRLEGMAMDDNHLTEIRERAEQATSGPWSAYHNNSEDPDKANWMITRATGVGDVPPERFFIAFVTQPIDPAVRRDGADAAFIAHAREDIPALLAENERVEAENKALRTEVEQLRSLRDLLNKDIHDDAMRMNALRHERDAMRTLLGEMAHRSWYGRVVVDDKGRQQFACCPFEECEQESDVGHSDIRHTPNCPVTRAIAFLKEHR